MNYFEYRRNSKIVAMEIQRFWLSENTVEYEIITISITKDPNLNGLKVEIFLSLTENDLSSFLNNTFIS